MSSTLKYIKEDFSNTLKSPVIDPKDATAISNWQRNVEHELLSNMWEVVKPHDDAVDSLIYGINKYGTEMSSFNKLTRDRLVQSPCGKLTQLQDAYSARDLIVNKNWVDITHLKCPACGGKSIESKKSCWNCDNVGYTEDV